MKTVLAARKGSKTDLALAAISMLLARDIGFQEKPGPKYVLKVDDTTASKLQVLFQDLSSQFSIDPSSKQGLVLMRGRKASLTLRFETTPRAVTVTLEGLSE